MFREKALITDQGKQKAAFTAAMRAWHRLLLPMAVPWNALFHETFLYLQIKNTTASNNIMKAFTAFCDPYRLSKRNVENDLWWVTPSRSLSIITGRGSGCKQITVSITRGYLLPEVLYPHTTISQSCLDLSYYFRGTHIDIYIFFFGGGNMLYSAPESNNTLLSHTSSNLKQRTISATINFPVDNLNRI